MATLKTVYLGNLRTEITHTQSGNTITTDAPIDNNGKGEFFSPTDLVAASLGSCMLTIIGIVTERSGIDISGTEIETTKVMSSEPRRISEINIIFTFPNKLEDKTMAIIKRAATTCPVYNSLDPNIKKEIIYKFKD